ncbi:MAG: hypothetical protein WC162_10905 [Sphaerochaetaceae bacterium]|nr:hypothetical protein [Sphaerochaetaceae bacterium]
MSGKKKYLLLTILFISMFNLFSEVISNDVFWDFTNFFIDGGQTNAIINQNKINVSSSAKSNNLIEVVEFKPLKWINNVNIVIEPVIQTIDGKACLINDEDSSIFLPIDYVIEYNPGSRPLLLVDQGLIGTFNDVPGTVALGYKRSFWLAMPSDVSSYPDGWYYGKFKITLLTNDGVELDEQEVPVYLGKNAEGIHKNNIAFNVFPDAWANNVNLNAFTKSNEIFQMGNIEVSFVGSIRFNKALLKSSSVMIKLSVNSNFKDEEFSFKLINAKTVTIPFLVSLDQKQWKTSTFSYSLIPFFNEWFKDESQDGEDNLVGILPIYAKSYDEYKPLVPGSYSSTIYVQILGNN